jgi:formamidopyrimidine-DNA glycosylase
MPELPDIELYIHALGPRILGKKLLSIRLSSPFLLRSVEPRTSELEDREVKQLSRLGKRLVLGFEDDYFAVLHLMIAGRLQWRAAATAIPKRLGLGAFDFADGTLVLTEAGSKKRASLHLVQGREGHCQLGAVGASLRRNR